MNIGNFEKIIEEKFPISEWEKKVQDERKQPIILPKTIFKLGIEMVPLGQRSLLQVDEYAEKPWCLDWHQSHRNKVTSDTTIERSLEGFNIEILRGILIEAYLSLDNLKASYKILPSGRKMRVGIVDGSDFGGFRASVFTIAGIVNAPIDLEPYSMGKELEATQKVLSRVKEKLGMNAVDIILGDGLYLTQNHIRHGKIELGSEVLIKTQDESLTIIQDAKGLFFGVAPERGDGIERVEGIDTNRMVEYRITACAGFSWQEENLPFEFKVAHVWERKLKPIKGRPEVEEFWVITTATSLSAEDMRELAHFRWEIENNTFKRLNSLVGSKRGYIHNEKVKKALLLLWFVGLILLGYWMVMRELQGQKKPKEGWRTIVETYRDLVILSYCRNTSG